MKSRKVKQLQAVFNYDNVKNKMLSGLNLKLEITAA